MNYCCCSCGGDPSRPAAIYKNRAAAACSDTVRRCTVSVDLTLFDGDRRRRCQAQVHQSRAHTIVQLRLSAFGPGFRNPNPFTNVLSEFWTVSHTDRQVRKARTAPSANPLPGVRRSHSPSEPPDANSPTKPTNLQQNHISICSRSTCFWHFFFSPPQSFHCSGVALTSHTS